MTLDFNTIRSAICGTAKISEQDGALWLSRFTEEQLEAYRSSSADFFKKAKSTAGIRLAFSTNSTSLSMTGACSAASSRSFYGFDVYVNGSLVCHTLDHTDQSYARYTLTAALGSTEEKQVCIYFPWSVQANIEQLSLDGGASFKPLKRPYQMLCFGDSITHGYDAHNPSFSYASRLADMLRADHVNKGIGAERFFPTLAALRDDFEPDYITVAYGTSSAAVRSI